MADLIIAPTVEIVLQKLIQEVNSIRNCKKDFRMLEKNVSMIQAFIQDAERRQVEDGHVKEWIMRLEGVAEDAENVFDQFTYETLRRKVKIRNNLMKQVGDYFPHKAFKCKMSRKIKNINEELTATYQFANNTLSLRPQGGPSRQIPPVRETDPFVVASDVVGRDKDVSAIKEKMLNMREDVVLLTIPIVGMGGLGKTTVAKRIFGDEHIMQLFETRVWLCLPEISESTSFLEATLNELTQKKLKVQSRVVIVKKLQEELGGKKHLLVLDDLWRVDGDSWDDFVDTLKAINISRGSCILVTTRDIKVASEVKGHHYTLKELAEDQCWSIFKKNAHGDGEILEEIESMRNRIAEICQGLPLAARVLGGLFRNKARHERQAILGSNPLVAGENSLKKILKLSFDYLPSPQLKKSFAYFAMFPKDFEFEKDQLIQLWMAEGFPHPFQEMEDVGNKFFELLLQNSLLQDAKQDEHCNITHCKMHDLVHDLAGDILKSKLFDPKGVGREDLSQVRYFGWDSPIAQIDKINEAQRLCTLFWRTNCISENMLLSFQFLRVLNFSRSGIKELSASIGKLICLRYLDLSDTQITALPNSVCKLYNLQTFRANNCHFLEELPDEMGNMISLRHIYYSSKDWGSWRIGNGHFQMPLKMGRLTCLQTLQFFKVGLEKGRRIEELGRLENLRGEMTINGLQLVRSREEARTSCLQMKPNIYRLAYLWLHDEQAESCETNDEYVLDGLQPHHKLETLAVVGYLGTTFPSWFSEEMLPKLVKLKLIGCKKCIEIPPLGQLKLLLHLKLDRFNNLECIGPTFYGVEVNNNGSSSNNAIVQVFPSLKKLVLNDMPSLTEWKEVELIPA